MAAVRPNNDVKFPALGLTIASMMCYFVLLNQLQAVNAEIPHGQSCNSADLCKIPTSCDQKKFTCLCLEQQYYESNTKKCETLTIYIMCNAQTDSVNCTLKQDGNRSITYQVSMNFDNQEHKFSPDRVEIKSLLPGRNYTGHVSAQIQSEHYNFSRNKAFSFWTKPDKPQCGNAYYKRLPKNPSDAYLYDITLNVPRGDVSRYKVTIDRLPGYQGIITQTTIISNIPMKPGTMYKFSITAYNGNNGPSEVGKCTFTIDPERSGKVRDISIDHQPCSTFINWTSPEHPNGKISHYVLVVRDVGVTMNGLCKWDCTRANKCEKRNAADGGSNQGSSLSCSTADFTFGDRMSVRLLDLEQNKTYNVSIEAVNEAGTGVAETQIMTTQMAAADVGHVLLSSFRYVTPNNTSSGKIKLKIRWGPSTSGGNISYNFDVWRAKGRQSLDFDRVETIEDFTGTEREIDDVLAHWNYRARVRAVSLKGVCSWVSSGVHTTVENNPGQVQNLNVVQNEKYARIFTVKFDCLDESEHNGTLSKYVIRSTLQAQNGDEVYDGKDDKIDTISPHSCGEAVNVTVSEVDRNYMFTVKAENQNYSGDYSKAIVRAALPKKPRLSENYPMISHFNAPKNEGPDFKIKLCISCLLNSSQGSVKNAGLTVCVIGDENDCEKMDADYENFTTWKESKKSGFTKPYRTTPDYWIANLPSQTDNYTFEVGVDANCDTNSEKQYCNGPLPEGKHVFISVVVCTKAGCDQVQQPEPILVRKRPESASNKTVPITLGVFALFILICVIAFLVSRRLAPSRWTWLQKTSTDATEISEGT